MLAMGLNFSLSVSIPTPSPRRIIGEQRACHLAGTSGEPRHDCQALFDTLRQKRPYERLEFRRLHSNRPGENIRDG